MYYLKKKVYLKEHVPLLEPPRPLLWKCREIQNQTHMFFCGHWYSILTTTQIALLLLHPFNALSIPFTSSQTLLCRTAENTASILLDTNEICVDWVRVRAIVYPSSNVSRLFHTDAGWNKTKVRFAVCVDFDPTLNMTQALLYISYASCVTLHFLILSTTFLTQNTAQVQVDTNNTFAGWLCRHAIIYHSSSVRSLYYMDTGRNITNVTSDFCVHSTPILNTTQTPLLAIRLFPQTTRAFCFVFASGFSLAPSFSHINVEPVRTPHGFYWPQSFSIMSRGICAQ